MRKRHVKQYFNKIIEKLKLIIYGFKGKSYTQSKRNCDVKCFRC